MLLVKIIIFNFFCILPTTLVVQVEQSVQCSRVKVIGQNHRRKTSARQYCWDVR